LECGGLTPLSALRAVLKRNQACALQNAPRQKSRRGRLSSIADKRGHTPWERRSPYRLFQETHHIFQMTGMRNSLPVRRPAFPEFAALSAGKSITPQNIIGV